MGKNRENRDTMERSCRADDGFGKLWMHKRWISYGSLQDKGDSRRLESNGSLSYEMDEPNIGRL